MHPQPSKNADAISTSRRKRPGKKRRILLREKIVAKLKHEERAAREKIEKEAAEREKRTRWNREKKIKRRVKEKMKKAREAVVEEVAGPAEGSGESVIANNKRAPKRTPNEREPFSSSEGPIGLYEHHQT